MRIGVVEQRTAPVDTLLYGFYSGYGLAAENGRYGNFLDARKETALVHVECRRYLLFPLGTEYGLPGGHTVVTVSDAACDVCLRLFTVGHHIGVTGQFPVQVCIREIYRK